MSTELTTQNTALMPTREVQASPLAMLIARGDDLNQINAENMERLLAMHERMEDRQARKDYFAAVSDFQSRCPIIEKADTAYDKQYARIDRIWRTIRPILTETGLSVTWQIFEIREGNIAHVEGDLAHRAGHSVRLIRDVPVPDQIKGQNKTQQAGSAETYAKRYALCAALGIVTGDDDDGAAAGSSTITEAQGNVIMDLFDGFPFPKDEQKGVMEWQKVTSIYDIPAGNFDNVVAQIKRKLKKIQEAA